MTVRVLLRGVAIAIAVAAVIDPTVTREVAKTERVSIVATVPEVLPHATRLRDRLSTAHATVELHKSASVAAACPSSGACVIVSRGEIPRHVTAGARLVGLVHVPPREDVRGAESPLLRIDAPDRVHRDATATLRIQTRRPVARIDILDGDTVVGSVAPQDRLSVDVPWVPIASGARALRVVADGEFADVGIIVESGVVPVLFYEPEATWLGTFVRRALDDDTRFAVGGRTRVAPPIAVRRGGSGALTAEALQEVGVVVATAPDRLTVSEVDLLERFVSRRGGSLIVLTDRRPTGASLRLLPHIVAERRETEPQQLGLLRASEWVAFAPGPGVSALASIDEQSVIVARDIGRGRLIVSGALDAWRYRQIDDGFNGFWRALAWEASVLAGPPLRVETDPVVAEPGEIVQVEVDAQTLVPTRIPAEFMISGAVTCGDVRTFLRLWPGARPGSFTGAFRVDEAARCSVTAAVAGESAATPVTFRDEWQPLASDDGQLTAIAAAHGAVFATSETDERLAGRIEEQLASNPEVVRTHPMRSAYWLLPFVLCLGGEWWLRRQAGLG